MVLAVASSPVRSFICVFAVIHTAPKEPKQLLRDSDRSHASSAAELLILRERRLLCTL